MQLNAARTLRKITLAGLCVSALTACVAGNIAHQQPAYAAEDLRPLELELTSNDGSLEFHYNNYNNRSLDHIKRVSGIIGTGSFTGEIMVPKGQAISIYGENPDISKYEVTGFRTVDPEVDSAKIHFEMIDARKQIRDEIEKLTDAQKVQVLKIAGLYDEVLNSPKYLAASARSRAYTELTVFLKETKTEWTPLGKYMKALDSHLDIGIRLNYLTNAAELTSMVSVLRMMAGG